MHIDRYPMPQIFLYFLLLRKCIACKRTSLFDRLKRRFYSILLKFAECSFHSLFTCTIRDFSSTYYVYDFHFLFYRCVYVLLAICYCVAFFVSSLHIMIMMIILYIMYYTKTHSYTCNWEHANLYAITSLNWLRWKKNLIHIHIFWDNHLKCK